ncbi:MAG: hypothetical protein Ct9H90mP16_05940 [Candidatus Poseidoniales archaeon]|nr:MAG: hypothetical protein Ct9H90mP16_05940 [Candidatus Poseidoniales archaeon]
MDAWLKNWIDEWDAQYEQMQADRKESPKNESKPSMWLDCFRKSLRWTHEFAKICRAICPNNRRNAPIFPALIFPDHELV